MCLKTCFLKPLSKFAQNFIHLPGFFFHISICNCTGSFIIESITKGLVFAKYLIDNTDVLLTSIIFPGVYCTLTPPL